MGAGRRRNEDIGSHVIAGLALEDEFLHGVAVAAEGRRDARMQRCPFRKTADLLDQRSANVVLPISDGLGRSDLCHPGGPRFEQLRCDLRQVPVHHALQSAGNIERRLGECIRTTRKSKAGFKATSVPMTFRALNNKGCRV